MTHRHTDRQTDTRSCRHKVIPPDDHDLKMIYIRTCVNICKVLGNILHWKIHCKTFIYEIINNSIHLWIYFAQLSSRLQCTHTNYALQSQVLRIRIMIKNRPFFCASKAWFERALHLQRVQSGFQIRKGSESRSATAFGMRFGPLWTGPVVWTNHALHSQVLRIRLSRQITIQNALFSRFKSLIWKSYAPTKGTIRLSNQERVRITIRNAVRHFVNRPSIRGAVVAERLEPRTSIPEVPGSSPGPAVAPLGKALYPHCLVFRRRL